MQEDKKKICELLLATLQETRKHSDLEKLEYIEDDNGYEFIIGMFKNGYTVRINVSGNSGYSMILSIMCRL